MKIKNIADVNKFIETLNKCDGQIELVTSEGDRLNLKSKLCQRMMFTKVFLQTKINKSEVIISNPEDREKLREYLVDK